MANVSFLIVGGTDAPGIQLVPDGHGGWKIVRVPGWNPEQMLDLASIVQATAAGARVKDAKLSQTVLNAAAPAVGAELSKVLGKQAEGANVVVVVANAG
jgi:hypothetical protein